MISVQWNGAGGTRGSVCALLHAAGANALCCSHSGEQSWDHQSHSSLYWRYFQQDTQNASRISSSPLKFSLLLQFWKPCCCFHPNRDDHKPCSQMHSGTPKSANSGQNSRFANHKMFILWTQKGHRTSQSIDIMQKQWTDSQLLTIPTFILHVVLLVLFDIIQCCLKKIR